MTRMKHYHQQGPRRQDASADTSGHIRTHVAMSFQRLLALRRCWAAAVRAEEYTIHVAASGSSVPPLISIISFWLLLRVFVSHSSWSFTRFTLSRLHPSSLHEAPSPQGTHQQQDVRLSEQRIEPKVSESCDLNSPTLRGLSRSSTSAAGRTACTCSDCPSGSSGHLQRHLLRGLVLELTRRNTQTITDYRKFGDPTVWH